MTDREVVIQAIEEAQRILAEYIEPGRRGAVATVKLLLDVLNVLDGREVVAALNRLKPGYGLHVVKREGTGPVKGHFVKSHQLERP